MNVMYLNVYGLYVYKKKAKENYLNKTQKRKHRLVLYPPASVGHCLQWKEIDNCSSPSMLSNGMGSSEKAFVLCSLWKNSPDALRVWQSCATKLNCFAFRFEDCVLRWLKYFCNGNVWSDVISFSEHIRYFAVFLNSVVLILRWYFVSYDSFERKLPRKQL